MSLHKEMMANIKEYGLSVLGVAGFAYSIGRAAIGQPDLIIRTDYHKTNHLLINMVHQYLADGGEIGIVTELIEGKNGEVMPIEIVPIERSLELVTQFTVQAEHFYDCNPSYVKDGFEVAYLQVLLPDANGKLPYQDGYDHKNMRQPMFKAKVTH